VILVADLSLSASASRDPAIVGSNLTYTITVTNHGPNLATGVVVTNRLPASVQFISASSSKGSFRICERNFHRQRRRPYECKLRQISLVEMPKFAGVFTNLLAVNGNEVDLVLTNNTVTIVTTVIPAGGPQMQVFLSDLNIIISWPSTAVDFVLETASSLAPPITWNPVTSAPADDGMQKTS